MIKICLSLFFFLATLGFSQESHLLKVDEANFEKVKKGEKYLLLDVSANFCAPCRFLEPILETLSNEYANQISFGKITAETDRELLKTLEVKAFPTLIFFQDGKEIARHIGALSEKEIKDKMEECFHLKREI